MDLRKALGARHLVITLIRRQFQVRYRQSFIGVTWALVPPLLTLAVGLILFRRVLDVDVGETPYVLFTLSGLIPWTFFTSSLTFGVPSIGNNQALIRRLAFPRAALPLSAVGISLIDLAVAGGLFVIAAFAFGEGLQLSALWFPLLLVLETLFVSGVVLLASALNAFATDFRLLVPVSTQLLFFVTPVLYPLSVVSERSERLEELFRLNPMTGFVESFRTILIFGRSPDLGTLLPSIVGTVVALVLGLWYFRATESRFADVV